MRPAKTARRRSVRELAVLHAHFARQVVGPSPSMRRVVFHTVQRRIRLRTTEISNVQFCGRRLAARKR